MTTIILLSGHARLRLAQFLTSSQNFKAMPCQIKLYHNKKYRWYPGLIKHREPNWNYTKEIITVMVVQGPKAGETFRIYDSLHIKE